MSDLTRRTMLAAAGAAPLLASAAGAAATPKPPARLTARPAPQEEKAPGLPPAERLGWAVVGIGKLTVNQIVPAFADTRGARLAGFVSGSAQKLAEHGRRHGVTSLYSYDDFDRIAADPAIQVVYVVLPNALHADFTVRALKAGKHVFCEKPMAPTAAECERMIAAANAADRRLGIAYRAHFEPHNVEALKRLKAGALGRLRFFTSDHGRTLDPAGDPADQWRASKALAGGGSLFDIGIYGLNAALMFAGEAPVEVSATIDTPQGDPRFTEVEDVISFRLRFPSGLIAACSSAYSWSEVKRYQLFGDKATMRLDPATDYYHNRLTLGTKEGEEEIDVQGDAITQFAREIDAFTAAVRENRPSETPGEMGLRDVRLIEAIYRSAREGRPVRV